MSQEQGKIYYAADDSIEEMMKEILSRPASPSGLNGDILLDTERHHIKKYLDLKASGPNEQNLEQLKKIESAFHASAELRAGHFRWWLKLQRDQLGGVATKQDADAIHY